MISTVKIYILYIYSMLHFWLVLAFVKTITFCIQRYLLQIKYVLKNEMTWLVVKSNVVFKWVRYKMEGMSVVITPPQ